MTQQARDEITHAETRIAKGIARLYQDYAPPADAYDAQGIATIHISEIELKESKNDITAYFPNKLKSGITLHFFRHDFIQHPPIRYMITEKLRSLYLAAKTALPEAIEEEILASVNKIILEARQESNTLGDGNIPLDQQAIRDQLIHKKADLLMQEFIGKALHALHQSHSKKDSALSYEQFAKQLITHTQQHLDHKTDTLTFNEETSCFSYEEAPNNKSKKRGFNENCANLGLVCEGRFSKVDIKATKIIASFIKHASLAPIDEITRIHFFDRNQRDLRVLLKSCELMEKVVAKMTRLRCRHGQRFNGKPLRIDWNYQLLTQSGLNSEKQATTYGYIIKAALLTSGTHFKVDGYDAIANINVINSEVTRFGHWGIGYKKDTQRRENRKTYLHLTKAIDGITLPNYKQDDDQLLDNLSQLHTNAQLLKKLLSPVTANEKELQEEYDKRQLELQSNAKRFYKFRKSHSTDDIMRNPTLIKEAREFIAYATECNDNIRKVTYKIEQIRLKRWKQNRKKIAHLREAIQEKIRERPDQLPPKDLLIPISALFYKSYMDELYYSNNYRGHTNGVLFNGYCTAYQHLTGTMASIGCNTSNNRTYVIRLIVAALQGKNSLLNTIPAPHYPLNRSLHHHAISNAALCASINHSAGGTPDVDVKRFPILHHIKNIHFFSTFWCYSAHLFHKMISKIKKFFTALSKKNDTDAIAQPPISGSMAQIIIPKLALPHSFSTPSLAASTECGSKSSGSSPDSPAASPKEDSDNSQTPSPPSFSPSPS